MRLALDIGGTSVKWALVTNDGIIQHSGEFPTDSSLQTFDFARQLVSRVDDYKSFYSGPIEIIGAGMAGFVDGQRGIVYESPNLPLIKNLELARVLEDEFKVPAYVENDATSAAWGEYLFGGHGCDDLLTVTLGTGIGGGLVLGGRLHRGTRGFAGEIGHTTLCPDGPKCPCGCMGCLELYISKAALEEDYREKAGLDVSVEPKVISERARNGDKAALDAWKAYGGRLGVSLAQAANLLDLGIIVLTGGILGAWDFFIEPLNETFNSYVLNPLKGKIRIVPSSLGGRAGTLGAAFLDKAAAKV